MSFLQAVNLLSIAFIPFSQILLDNMLHKLLFESANYFCA